MAAPIPEPSEQPSATPLPQVEEEEKVQMPMVEPESKEDSPGMR